MVEHAVHRVVGRRHPGDLARWAKRAQREPQRPARAATATPGATDPHSANRSKIAAITPVTASSGSSGSRPSSSPHTSPTGSASAQLAAGGLVADPALQPGPQHVQLRLAHGALQPQQQPVVERARVVEPVGVGDQRVGHPAQVQQPVPVGVVAGQPGDLQRRAPSRPARARPRRPAARTRTARTARAADAEVLVDHDDLLAREPSSIARSTSSYWRAVDSTLRSNCAWEDWRRYTNAWRRRCELVSFERSLTVSAPIAVRRVRRAPADRTRARAPRPGAGARPPALPA